MRTVLTALLSLILLFASVPAHALKLQWDPVTTGQDGLPLASGTEVTEYRLYQCQSSSCTKSNAVLFAVIPAPDTFMDITGMTNIVPRTYFVTAVNVIGESAESNTVRLVPPDLPKNHRSGQ